MVEVVDVLCKEFFNKFLVCVCVREGEREKRINYSVPKGDILNKMLNF